MDAIGTSTRCPASKKLSLQFFATPPASEMTYTVSGGALNSTQSNPPPQKKRNPLP